MSSLFGVELPTAVNFVIAFVVVLVLIGAAAWLVRRFGATTLDAAARGRQPRLAVIDSAPVDGRRKLVIIRRDNVEHLLMIGGPTDVVVETSIVRAAAASGREAAPVRNGNGEHATRAMALADQDPWPLQPEPMPAAAQGTPIMRGPRPTVDEVSQWQTQPAEPAAPPPLRAVRPADTLAGLAAELSRPPEAAALTRPPEPAPVAPQQQPAPAPHVAVPTDQSLAEMAQRLEAALRRPAPPKMAVEGTAARSAEPKAARAAAAAPKTAAAAQARPAPSPGNLEKEMASLLGRPGKT